ncbi:integrase [Thioalkalivibrio versutus]|uniref:Integrase n=1 Tax=Thioalkalivibrio versutus TaxID=106634 RepID=A0A0G3G622_9GAMM|nr:site-specific integrase [Thioalkalivibrio versutus]AKJ94967.1 integrase [Thioalkalivibrio versutus]
MGNIRARKENGRLYLDFSYRKTRCREYTALDDTPSNRKRLQKMLERIEAEILVGTFDYAKTFPNSPRAERFSQPTSVLQAAEGPDAGPTFREFGETWFAENEPTWKPSYRTKLRDIFDKQLAPQFGEKKVSDIQKSEILQYRAELAKVCRDTGKTLSASRINQIMNVLRQILVEAADRFDFITPYQGIKPLRVPRTQVDPFSLEEVQKFLDTVDPQWRPYFIVRFFTGMRTSEVDGLKWKYVDFDRREILVHSARVNGEDTTTKTDGSMRTIQMSALVYQVLIEVREAMNKRPANCRSDYVFSSRFGYPLSYHNVNYRIWYPTLKKAGLKRRNPYQTRHTAATLWLASGESPEWIARQMGHSNTKMLFTVYSRYVPNLTRQDGSAIDRLLTSRIQMPGEPTVDSAQEVPNHE